MQQRDKLTLAMLSAFAVAITGFERFIPTPVPWLRFGLANIIILITLILYGFKAAFTVSLIRVIGGSIMTGTFLGPAFVLSLNGSVLSVLSMGALFRIMPKIFSPIGLSLIGALFHNLGQILSAYFLFIQNFRAILVITPIILLLGTLTGAANGIVTAVALERLKKSRDNVHNT
ncbi:MAG: Gx transporter family protein [Nitrospirae bacterium]|nr:Gx transporter family protein [Nitrospirota bacterium]